MMSRRSAVLSGAAVLLSVVAATLAFGQQVQPTVKVNNTQFQLDLSSVPQFNLTTVTLENTGASPVIMPEVTAANAPPGTNSAAILGWLQAQGGSSAPALAEAAWQYVNGQLFAQMYALSAPFEGYYETRIPWRLFRGYGFGGCDQEAYPLAWLWHLSGFSSRVVTLPGHVVAEVYYDNAWHMYDSNHRVFYLNPDGTVASVAQIMANPTLVAQAAGPDGLDPIGMATALMEELYANADPTYTTPNWSLSWWNDPTYTLSYNESLVMYSENITADVIYGAGFHVAPSFVSSATLIRTINFNDPNWKLGVLSTSGMAVSTIDSQTVLANTANSGTIVLYRDSPSPAFDLQLDGQFYRASASTTIKVYVSPDDINWQSAYFVINTPVGAFQPGSLNLTSVTRGMYSWYVKIQVTGAPGAVRISSLKLTSNVQISKSSIPTLTPGSVNDLIYRDASADAQSRDINVKVAVYSDAPTPLGMTVPLTQNMTVPASSSVSNLESILRSPEVFYPWLAYGSSTASATLWQAQQNGDVLQAAATTPGNYLVTGANLTWNTRNPGPISWSLAKREPVSLNFDWIQPPRTTFSSGAMAESLSTGDQFILSTSLGGTISLLGRPLFKNATVTSLVPENPIFSIAMGYGAQHLMDGNLRSLAYPASTQFDYLIDLGTVAHVSAASLLWGSYGANPAYIQNWVLYGRNGSSAPWQVLAQGGFPAAETTTLELDSVVSQLRITASSTNWIGMYEAQVVASPLVPVTATTNVWEDPNLYDLGRASALVDGNDHTLAYPGGNHIDYTLDPGNNFYVDRVQVVWGYFGTSQLYVNSWRLYGQPFVGTTWTLIARGGFPGATESTIPVRTNYRRLRLAADGANFIGAYEVQVYGNLLTQ